MTRKQTKAWVKIPAAHHPIFRAALPRSPRLETVQMFGGIAAKTNGRMVAALFGSSAMVVLSDADRDEALALDGAAPFDPMGTRTTPTNKVLLPADVMDSPEDLRDWLRRAFDHVRSLPAKPKTRENTRTKPRDKRPAGKRSAR